MPTTTPLVKVNTTKDYGARVILHGEVFDEAAEKAAQLAGEEGLTYVHPFNDLGVATGQGTIAYEIFQDLPDVDVILVPIGGGGLAAGVSTLAKLLNPNVIVIGVEPEGAASTMYKKMWTASCLSRMWNWWTPSWTSWKSTRWWWKTPVCSPWPP